MEKKIDIATVTRAAFVIKNEVEILRQQAARINNAKENIRAAWTDSTERRNADKYIQAIEENLEVLNKKIGLYDDLAAILENAAKKYSDIEVSGNGGAF